MEWTKKHLKAPHCRLEEWHCRVRNCLWYILNQKFTQWESWDEIKMICAKGMHVLMLLLTLRILMILIIRSMMMRNCWEKCFINKYNIHKDSRRTLISTHTLVFIDLDVGRGYDQISPQVWPRMCKFESASQRSKRRKRRNIRSQEPSGCSEKQTEFRNKQIVKLHFFWHAI